ncbi:hypothetical protein ONE63_011445 [Megalurothrips usitatus]|uniref:C2H2-type domain-containing protein n=1 Tax=Megalurothrips usitatus TaxID=439358 RepID=A0AAV7X2E4_9NEOP|nr:hypothetical protein ONE63_011445 [Megalurothrips usitatus]
MYRHVVAQLDSRMAAEVEDILTGPPEGQTYENLKKQLIARLSLSEERRINQLLAEEDIGDRTPSQFLRHLRALAGGSAAVNDAVMKRIWTRRLPSHVTAILASQPDLDLDKLAPLADRVLEAAPGIPSVHAVSTAAAPGPVDALAKMIETLAGRVEALTQQSRSRSRGRSRSRNNNNDGGGARGGSDSGLCWYHERRLLTGRRHVKTNYALSAANNSNIATYGLFLLKLNLPGLRRDLTWSFIVADVSVPIIGSDFLAHYHLLPDCKWKRLHDATTGLFADCQSRSIAQPSVRAVAVDLPGADILAEFPDVTRPAGRPREVSTICPLCNKTLQSTRGLKVHMTRSHKNHQGNISDTTTSTPTTSASTTPTTRARSQKSSQSADFRCSECNTLLSTASRFLRHRASHKLQDIHCRLPDPSVFIVESLETVMDEILIEILEEPVSACKSTPLPPVLNP